MAEFGRVCGGQAGLFRAILARISHLNKLPVSSLSTIVNQLLVGPFTVYQPRIGALFIQLQ